jgi:predicted permease
MRLVKRAFAKTASLFFGNRAEREMAREIQSHLAIAQDEFERRGLSPPEARLAALRSFGGVEQAKELHRGERSFLWIAQTTQDLRHACRGLARSPGFTFTAIIALALGIGVNTTLFSLFNAVALKPLPISDPNHVVRFERWFESRARGNVQYGFSYPEYIYCRDHAAEFSSLVAASWLFGAHTSASTPRIAIQLVSANYFPDLGIPLALGRGFLPDEDRNPSANAVAVLSYPYWQRAFHADPGIVGHPLIVNGTAFAVIGITREGFTGTSLDPQTPDLWAPLSMQSQLVPGMDWFNQPNTRLLEIFARLKPATLRQTAQAQADLLIRQFDSTLPETDKTTAVTLQRTTYFPNVDDLRFQALVSALMLIVGMVLFVACANVGNMLLARGASRQREIGTRLALGASRLRVVRQLLAESVLVSCVGGVAALLLSFWTTKLLAVAFQNNAMLIGGNFSAVNLTPDLRVMAYVAAISLAAGIAFGISPALQFSKPDISSALKQEGAGLGRLRGSRLQSFLVAAQVAVSVLLLAIAGLLARGLIRSQAAEPGFDTRNVFVVAADFAGPDVVKAAARQKLLLERLRQRPEIAAVALGNLPLLGTWTPPIIVGSSRGRTLASFASDAYFGLLGIPLQRGRAFTVQEAASDAPLAVISESTARRFWPNEDPIGKYLTLDMDFRGKLADFEVIGIVKDVRFANLTRIDPAHVYLPVGTPMGALFSYKGLLLRIQGGRERALAAVADTVGAFDRNLLPDLKVVNLEDGVVTLQRAMSRGLTVLGVILAALSLTLAGVGIYGVMAYLVSRRTREIGVRVALGATHRDVVKNLLGRGLHPVFIGTLLGLAAATALSWMLHATLVFPGSMDFFYGVPFYDPATFVGLICFVLGIAAAASALPARRAMAVDPLVALRYE